jgi:hypothetical protein
MVAQPRTCGHDDDLNQLRQRPDSPSGELIREAGVSRSSSFDPEAIILARALLANVA